MLFIYLLIEEVKYYPSDMTIILPPRKRGYYDGGIYNVVLILNICSGVARIIGSALLFLYRLKLKTLEQRSILLYLL